MITTASLQFEETRKPLYECVFSPDRVFRYVLVDSWAPQKGRAMFIGLNPSTADEYQLDPTLKRIRRWVELWGLGGFVMTNLFAFRSPHPAVMQAAPDPVGPENDKRILEFAESSEMIVAAWGNGGAFQGRAGSVETLIAEVAFRLVPDVHCLGFTKDGFPIHPLARGKHRVPDNITPRPFVK